MRDGKGKRGCWLIVVVLLLVGVGAAFILPTGWQIESSSGHLRWRLAGVPVRHRRLPSRITGQLVALAETCDMESRWHSLAEGADSEDLILWSRGYSLVAAWLEVDPGVAVEMMQALSEAIERGNAPDDLPFLSVFLPWPHETPYGSGIGNWVVTPGWTRSPGLVDFVAERDGHVTASEADDVKSVVPYAWREVLRAEGLDAQRLRALAGWSDVHVAVAIGEHAGLPERVQKERDLYSGNEGGYTPLHIAAQANRTEVVGLLLGEGGLVNASTHAGWTPLACAAGAGALETVELLLKHGADVRIADYRGRRAIHWAPLYGNATCVQALLAAGADPNAADAYGQTPLDYGAIMRVVRSPQTKAALLAAGAVYGKIGDTDSGPPER